VQIPALVSTALAAAGDFGAQFQADMGSIGKDGGAALQDGLAAGMDPAGGGGGGGGGKSGGGGAGGAVAKAKLAKGLSDQVIGAVQDVIDSGTATLAGSDLGNGISTGLLSTLGDARQQLATTLSGITDAISGTMSTAIPDAMQTAMASFQSSGEALTVPQFGSAIRAMGFDENTIESICGPIAAAGISKGLGHAMSLVDVAALSHKIGAWTPGDETHGVPAFEKILTAMGIDSRTGTFQEAVNAAMQGIPVAISTPLHYFLAQGFDQATQQFIVDNTGTALKAGAEKMTLGAIQGVAGAATFIIPQVQAAGAAVSSALASGLAGGDNSALANHFEDLAKKVDDVVGGAMDKIGALTQATTDTMNEAWKKHGDTITAAMDAAQASIDKIASDHALQASIDAQKQAVTDLEAIQDGAFKAQETQKELAYQHDQALAHIERTLNEDLAKAKTAADTASAEARKASSLLSLSDSEADGRTAADHAKQMADDVAAHDKIKKKETDDLNALLQSEADNRAIAGFNKTKDAAIAAADAQYIKIVIDSATAEATKTQNILDEMAKQLTAVGETYSREKDLGTEAAQGIQDFIDGINKDVEITVHTHYVSDGGGDVGHNAGGTSNWRGGLTWVGEQGPELVNLPRGAQVIAEWLTGTERRWQRHRRLYAVRRSTA